MRTSSSAANSEAGVLFDCGEPEVRATQQNAVLRTSAPHEDPAGKSERRRTLLTGMHYEIAATHSDPRAFFDRMVLQYGLQLKQRR